MLRHGIKPINPIGGGVPPIEAYALDYYGTNTPDKAIDDNLTTYYRSATASGSWFAIDLGEILLIEDLKITKTSYAFPGIYTIETANDRDFTVGKTTIFDTDNAGNYVDVYDDRDFGIVDTRFIRLLSGEPTNVTYINEFEWNLGTVPQYRAYAKTIHNATNIPDKVLDGNTATFYRSAIATGAWIAIDLGESILISTLRITKNAAIYPANYDIEIADDRDFTINKSVILNVSSVTDIDEFDSGDFGVVNTRYIRIYSLETVNQIYMKEIEWNY